MPTRPRALIEPKRPNVRRIPLDPFELEQANCPPIPTQKPGLSKGALKAFAISLISMLTLCGLLAWWVTR
jgi:hypothetical protein